MRKTLIVVAEVLGVLAASAVLALILTWFIMWAMAPAAAAAVYGLLVYTAGA